jgi:quinol monooxygenase YgiN
MPVEDDDMDDDSSSGMPRPYGRLSIYTLREDKTREFDQIAERAAEGVRTSEPDTLVYVIHVVPKAPQQRIIYEIYRDRTAFMSHERQPHIRQFAAERASCVLATNIIDLRLKYAKVAALGGPSDAGAQPQGQSGRGQRQEAPTQAPQYTPSGQYPTARPQGQGASFTPAGGGGGRQGYSQPPPGQYGNSGTGAYGAGNGQYDAANSNGYSGGAGYSNGGSYPSSGYPGANGYSGDNGYPDANGYQGANGADGANGYQGANGYPNGANGYGASNGYSNDGSAGAAGYGESGAGSHSAAPSTQYTPRYRELTSGTSTDLGSAGYGPEWDQGQQGYRQ